MMQILKRSMRRFIPTEPSVFNSDGKLLLFDYHDDHIYRELILAGAGCSASFMAFYYFNPISWMPLLGIGAAGLFMGSALLSASRTVSKLSLLQDGKTIELETFAYSKVRKYYLSIEDIECAKGKEGYKMYSKSKTFNLEQEGKIHNLHLFLAVMRRLSIDDSMFETRQDVKIN